MYLTLFNEIKEEQWIIKETNSIYIYPKNEKYGYGIGELAGIINTTLTNTVEKRIND